MSYSDFCNKVESAMSGLYEGEAQVYITDVTKNNGLILRGLVIQRKESRISPTIYLEQFYGMYEDGMSFSEVINRIRSCDRAYKGTDITVDMFMDFEKISDRIVYKVVNRDMNSELLKSVPYMEWNDLAIVFCCLLESKSDGYATILIRNEHVKSWGTDTDELYKLASVNTPRLMSDEIDSMENIIMSMLYRKNPEDEGDSEDRMNPAVPDLYVLSNKRRIFGATSMLFSPHIGELADDYESDLYILPSSIHEVIILPYSESCDVDYMRSMVREINETQVDIEDRLSDNIYCYDRNTRKISVVAG